LVKRRTLLLALPALAPRAQATALADLSLPRLDAAAPPFKPSQLRGRRWLLNLWATWCAPCRAEHPLLLHLAPQARDAGVPLLGLAVMDKASTVSRWLAAQGNPYSELLLDAEGTVGNHWGTGSLPATLLVDATGRVAWRHEGPLTEALLGRDLLPRLRLRQRQPRI
jgi:cytochrome c biogenesis protein CcmG, thiol:disulfide interchange protein DsbE